MKNGRFVNTIYGRKFISEESEHKENFVIVVVGLLAMIIVFLFN